MTTSRRGRRRQMYLVGVLPSLLLLLLSARIALVLIHDTDGQARYAASDYEDARDRFRGNGSLNLIEPWLAPFNEGDARYRLVDFRGALAAFEAALPDAPADRQCTVRVNLALTHEAIGDQAGREGDRPAARNSWSSGRAMLTPCVSEPAVEDTEASDRTTSDHATAERVDIRLKSKLGPEQPVVTRATQVRAVDNTEAHEREIIERNRQALTERRRGDEEPGLRPRTSSKPPVAPQW